MKKCNTCHRAGDTVGTCGSFATCPGFAGQHGLPLKDRKLDLTGFPDVDPSKDIVLECPACNQTVAMPAHDVMVGETRVDFRCGRSPEHCEARVVPQTQPSSRTASAKKT